MNPIIRIAAAALVVALFVGGAIVAFRLTASIGPPAPTIEGTWETQSTRAEMLAAGIEDSGEDNPENWGHFVVTIQQGHFGSIQLSGPMSVGPSAVYAVHGSTVTVTYPDGVAFDWTFAVTETTLTFGGDGPVYLRAKPWTRVGSSTAPSGERLTLGPYRSAWKAICEAAVNASPVAHEELWAFERLYDPAMSAADRALSLEVGREIADRMVALAEQLQALNPPANLAADHLVYVTRLHGTAAIVRDEVDLLAAGDLDGARALDESTGALSVERERYEGNWGLESCP